MSTRRLVNVFAKPSGRLGAPDAEPGPWGIDVVLMMSSSLAQGPERGAQLAREELRLLPRGEVPTPLGLVEVDDVRIDLLHPAARGAEDLVGERGERNRERDRRRSLAGGQCRG